MVQQVRIGAEQDAPLPPPDALSQLSQMAHLLADLFDAPTIGIALLDAHGGELQPSIARGWHGDATSPVGRLPGGSLARWVATHLEPAFLDDARRDSRFSAELAPLRSVMCAPLVDSGRLVGTLFVGRTRAHAYDARQRELFLALCELLASVIGARYRIEAGRSHIREQTGMLEAARALAGAEDAQHVAAATLDALHHIAGTEDALIYIAEAGGERLRPLASSGERLAPLERVSVATRADDSLAAWVARQRRARGVSAGEEHADAWRELTLAGADPVLAVPLIYHDHLRGAALLIRAAPFTTDELATIMSLSGFAAGALESVERYQAARIEREKLATIFESASDGIAVVDSELTIVEANTAFAELVGHPRAQLVGRQCCDVLQRTSADTCGLCEGECLLARTLASHEAMPHIECEFLLAHGQRPPASTTGARVPNRVIDFSLTPMAGPAGQQVLLVGRDVTASRTMDQMKAHFLSIISHELRAPLQTISGYVDLVLSGAGGELSAEQNEFLRRARAGSEHLTSLVDDLLLISRRDAGQFNLTLKETDARPVLEETCDEVELLAEVAGVALVLELPPELPLILGDGPRLRQVVRNLISNAIKFTPAGGQVTVSATAEDGWMTVRVRDTGIGIPPEHQDRIFDRFYQVDAVSAHGRFQGQGLGLAIVRIITEGHGGTVTVASTPDAGSTFTVRLPLAPTPGAAE